MVIGRMNSVFVKHGRWFFAIFTVVIIISFVWYFSPGLDGSIFMPNPNSPTATAGKVFGKKVTRGQLVNTASSMTIALAAAYGVPPDARIHDSLWEHAFDNYASLAAASKLGITVSDSEVSEYIKNMQSFRNEKGAFDLKRFNEYVKTKLEPSGYSAQDLDESVRMLLAIMKLQRLASSESIVTPDEVKQYQLSSGESFEVRVARFKAKDFESEVSVSEEALKSFYASNNQFFIIAPKFSAETVRFNYMAYEKEAASKVTDAMVKEFYDKNPANFKKGDKGETTPFAEAAPKIKKDMVDAFAMNLALKAARSFRDALYEATADAVTGTAHVEAFRALAKTRGFDSYATGWFDGTSDAVKNVGKEAAFVEAVSKTTKRYPITKVVSGAKAAFVAILVDYKEAAPGEFNEVKAKVEERYRQLKSISLAKEKAADAALKISDSKNAVAAVDAFALGKIKFEKLPAFSQMNPPNCPDAGDIMELAVALQPGKLSKTQETPEGAILVFLDKRQPPSEAEMEKGRQMADLVYKQYKQRALVDSFNAWLMSNTENYMQQQERQSRQGRAN